MHREVNKGLDLLLSRVCPAGRQLSVDLIADGKLEIEDDMRFLWGASFGHSVSRNDVLCDRGFEFVSAT